MKILKRLLSVILLSLLIGCTSPEIYLNKAVDIMAENSIKRDSIDWVKFRKDVLEKGKNARSLKETYPAIRYALKQLGDHHSFLLTNESKETANAKNTLPPIKSELINGNIGYISIPEFAGNDKLAHEYALELQTIITAFDKHSIEGWIIDLQENRGGNMWPMILGLGPLFEKDTLGYFVDPHNSYFEWIYSKGTVSIGKAEIMKLKDFHLLQNKNKKKAVLIGVKTASSGEATAIAFKGSANTKFFGHATRGLSTGNQGYSLSDGATLILTTSTFVDRNKRVYGHAIEPELYGSNAREEAVNWIKNE